MRTGTDFFGYPPGMLSCSLIAPPTLRHRAIALLNHDDIGDSRSPLFPLQLGALPAHETTSSVGHV